MKPLKIIIISFLLILIGTSFANAYVYHIGSNNSIIAYSSSSKQKINLINMQLDPISEMQTVGNCTDFKLNLNKLYCIEGYYLIEREIPILNITNQITFEKMVYALRLYNNYIYVAGDNVLYVIDMYTFEIITSIEILGIGKDIDIYNDHIYVASTWGLLIYDLNLELMGACNTWYAQGLEIVWPFVFIADDLKIIRVNVESINSPYVDRYSDYFPCKKVHFYRGYLYGSYKDGILVFDENLNKINNIIIGDCGDFIIRGDWLYSGTGHNVSLQQIDIDQDGYLGLEGDCDSYDNNIYPGAEEICDGKDNNCDGVTLPTEIDSDKDGVMLCEGDTDDTNHKVYPVMSLNNPYYIFRFSAYPIYYNLFYRPAYYLPIVWYWTLWR